MTIRTVTPADAADFYRMLCRLDEETDFMMYEPGERQGSPEKLKGVIDSAVNGGDLLLAAEDEREGIIGFLWAERGGLNRTRHTAYIVTGIRRDWRRQGIGTELFRRTEAWARENGVTRLELTVECENTAAVALYEKQGFRTEGLRRETMNVNGKMRDEYSMARLLNTEQPEGSPFSPEALISFRLEANRNTYAAKKNETAPTRPGSHDFRYEKGPWTYHDTYVGGTCFAGQEAIWYRGTCVYAMNYSGRVTGEDFSGDFLKRALLAAGPELPYRGPAEYREADDLYRCSVCGSTDRFQGREEILHQGKPVYDCVFHGGRME